MGTLRTLFAITVVFAHSYGYVFVGGRNAVQLFYMISGFLISYVLVERKTYSNISSFYINRYLRLFPIYFTIALLTLILYTIGFLLGKNVIFFEVYQNAPFAAKLFLIFSNTTLFLQDLVMFAGVENNELVFFANFYESEIPLYQGLLVPQAWTLGVELTFYLIAPFILSNQRLIFTLLFLSISLRIYLIYIGLGMKDPWTYRFFPAELAFFLLGAVAHQLLLPLYRNMILKGNIDKYAVYATCSLIIITLFFWLIPIKEYIKTLGFFSLFLILMPLAFSFSQRRKWDILIGDLSYPIYICHLLVIQVIEFLFRKLEINNKILMSLTAVFISVSFSVFLNIFIGNRIELLRNQFRRKLNQSS